MNSEIIYRLARQQLDDRYRDADNYRLARIARRHRPATSRRMYGVFSLKRRPATV